jgi:6-phosphogluconate dehydrogenase (decarboxylating)
MLFIPLLRRSVLCALLLSSFLVARAAALLDKIADVNGIRLCHLVASALIEQAELLDTRLPDIIAKGSGHWLIEETADQVVPALVQSLTQQAE